MGARTITQPKSHSFERIALCRARAATTRRVSTISGDVIGVYSTSVLRGDLNERRGNVVSFRVPRCVRCSGSAKTREVRRLRKEDIRVRACDES